MSIFDQLFSAASCLSSIHTLFSTNSFFITISINKIRIVYVNIFLLRNLCMFSISSSYIRASSKIKAFRQSSAKSMVFSTSCVVIYMMTIHVHSHLIEQCCMILFARPFFLIFHLWLRKSQFWNFVDVLNRSEAHPISINFTITIYALLKMNQLQKSMEQICLEVQQELRNMYDSTQKRIADFRKRYNEYNSGEWIIEQEKKRTKSMKFFNGCTRSRMSMLTWRKKQISVRKKSALSKKC